MPPAPRLPRHQRPLSIADVRVRLEDCRRLPPVCWSVLSLSLSLSLSLFCSCVCRARGSFVHVAASVCHRKKKGEGGDRQAGRGTANQPSTAPGRAEKMAGSASPFSSSSSLPPPQSIFWSGAAPALRGSCGGAG